MDLELTAYGDAAEDSRALVPEPNRCESCGTPVSLVDVMALIRALGGLNPAESRPELMEQRMVLEPGKGSLQLRPHTPDRCGRVQAGDPEPWDDPETWDDEDDGDE